MMIPITRKEKYINEIVGGGNTAPETPQTREELFFADILGEVVAPSPITRAEKYLAKIANKYSGELPEPVTRVERFLARAAGMDITVPVPITREEIFWSNYTAIVEFEIENAPPLTYKAIEGTLKNYRIYGNTENGESVGDRTENLFDKTKTNRQYNAARNADGSMNYSTTASNYFDYYIPANPNTTYTFSSARYSPTRIYYFSNSKQWIGRSDMNDTYVFNTYTFITPNDCYYIQFQENQNAIIPERSIMLNTGSTPLPYEPYGYRVPVTVTNGTDTQTTNLYLPEQIKMVGDEAEYIDFGEQKMHRIGADDIDLTLPALPTLPGTNVLSVGTAVQPSEVYIKYEGER